MNDDKHKTTPKEAARMFTRYHVALKAAGRTCGCCPENIDAAEAAAGYEAAKREASRVKEATP